MRVLSGRQPWWHAILHMEKRIENRKWSHSYRGPILLHASAGVGTGREFHGDVEKLANLLPEEQWLAFRDEHLGIAHRSGEALWLPHNMQQGGIIGRARIVRVIPKGTGTVQATTLAGLYGVDLRWWFPEQNGYILADVEPIPFFACKGALGLWEPTAEILAHVAKHDAGAGT